MIHKPKWKTLEVVASFSGSKGKLVVSGVALNVLMFKGFVKCGDLEESCQKTKKD